MSAGRHNETLLRHVCLGGPFATRAELAERTGLSATTLPNPAVLALYRRLVRGNVLGVIEGVLERTATALRELGRLEDDVQAFLRERGPRTPQLRDVPGEFVHYTREIWCAAGLAWVEDLAMLELAEFRMGYLPRRASTATPSPVALDRALWLRAPVELLELRFAVQAAREAGGLPEADAHTLLLYRDDQESVRTLRLTPMAARILAPLLDGAPLGDALVAAAAAQGVPLDQSVLDGCARLLAELGEREVVLGGAPLE